MANNIRAGETSQVLINGREFDAAAESGYTINLGGLDNETKITGNGELHTEQRRVPASISDMALSIDATRGDLEYLEDLKNRGAAVPVSITLVSNITYFGNLVIEGEMPYSAGEGQVTLQMNGSRIEQI